jgi:preprotein translocase subunit SecA
MLEFLKKYLDNDNSKYLAKSQVLVDKINSLEPAIKALNDEELKAKTAEFKARLKQGASLDDILPEAFAVVREAAWRTLGQRHYDVQLIGGAVLHRSGIAEMKTGEGKTLVATLPTYLNALTERGVHLVTVNDYLARRDVAWMGQIYDFLGLTVAVINHNSSYFYDPSHVQDATADLKRDEVGSFQVVYDFLRPCTRREAYHADITYGTNNEFGFDYLRDNLAYTEPQVAQKHDPVTGRFHYAIIDEVDSILIDEARTPLIISAPVAESESLYGTFATIAARLQEEEDYTVDRKLKAITLTDEGINKAEQALGVDNIYTEKGIKYVHHLETAVRAKAIFIRDKDYVVTNGEAVIVDEFTGRLQPGRRWSEGLHQAIEAKEGIAVQQETRTFASVTLQNYFRLYEKLAGMTGTAATSAEEFLKVYGLETVSVPPHRPSARRDEADLVFQSEKGKYQALTRQVKELQVKGQPVLIGTVSVEKNELLSAYFSREGVKHQLLNAKNHEQEGQIVANAGKKGSVVIATNMAGRGVDIKLGGATPTPEEYEEVKSLGGLFVIGTERHEARRIDNQLRGRAGRQGDPGATQFYISLEDTLMRIFGPDRVKGMMGRFGIPEDEPIQARIVSRAIESAQTKIEGMNFDLRKHLLEYDDVMNHQRVTIYDRRRKVLFGGEPEVTEFLEKAYEALEYTPAEREEAERILAEKKEALGADVLAAELRKVILQVIDMLWVEHLEAVDYMRSSVRLRAYGQRDPLVEFKREGLILFKTMEASIFENVLRVVPNIGEGMKVDQAKEMQAVHEGASLILGGANPPTPRQGQAPAGAQVGNPANRGQFGKVGRNDPCPCGATKADGTAIKYKHCHGK